MNKNINEELLQTTGKIYLFYIQIKKITYLQLTYVKIYFIYYD